jgi:hypothetical protein
MKLKQTITNVTKSTTLEADVTKSSWEFFKKLEGLNTDLITKMIPSTAITPIKSMLSVEVFNEAIMAAAVIAGVAAKVKELSTLFSSSGSVVIGAEIVKASVGNSFIAEGEYKS